jgi:hypothetical protein
MGQFQRQRRLADPTHTPHVGDGDADLADGLGQLAQFFLPTLEGDGRFRDLVEKDDTDELRKWMLS